VHSLESRCKCVNTPFLTKTKHLREFFLKIQSQKKPKLSWSSRGHLYLYLWWVIIMQFLRYDLFNNSSFIWLLQDINKGNYLCWFNPNIFWHATTMGTQWQKSKSAKMLAKLNWAFSPFMIGEVPQWIIHGWLDGGGVWSFVQGGLTRCCNLDFVLVFRE